MFRMMKVFCLFVLLVAVAPVQAQFGGVQAVTDTQRVEKKFHVFMMVDGQRLLVPYVLSDTISARGDTVIVLKPIVFQDQLVAIGVSKLVGKTAVGHNATPLNELDVQRVDGGTDTNYLVRLINGETTAGENRGVYVQAGIGGGTDEVLRIDGSSILLALLGNGAFGLGDATPSGEATRERVYYNGTEDKPLREMHSDNASHTGGMEKLTNDGTGATRTVTHGVSNVPLETIIAGQDSGISRTGFFRYGGGMDVFTDDSSGILLAGSSISGRLNVSLQTSGGVGVGSATYYVHGNAVYATCSIEAQSNAIFDSRTVALGGATGDDGDVTISVLAGSPAKVYIENRSAASLTGTWTYSGF